MIKGIDSKRLRDDAMRLKATQGHSPIGRRKTGATDVIREHFTELRRLHFEEGARWTELAAALADQGVTQGDGKRLTGRRLTALMRNVERQIKKQNDGKANRMARGDLVRPASNRNAIGKLSLAPELTHHQSRAKQQEVVTEEEIRQAALVRHAQLLNKK
jgi:hypothetical protein